MNKDSVIRFLQDVFKQEFNHSFVDGWVQNNGITDSGWLNNLFFKGTDFYMQSFDKKYLHFTKSSNAIDILNSGCLWLSNLNAFNDDLELLLAASELLDIPVESLNEYKDNLFAACFTELSQSGDAFSDFPYHWQRYSNDGDGVALEFEFGPKYKVGIKEDPVLRPFYYLMKVQYHNDPVQNKIFAKLRNKLGEFRNISDVNEDGLIKFLFPFLCAFKREKNEKEYYELEKEVRLFYKGTGAPEHYNINKDYTREEETYGGYDGDSYLSYRQLPCNIEETFLKLKRIYLGDKISTNTILAITEKSVKAGVICGSKED